MRTGQSANSPAFLLSAPRVAGKGYSVPLGCHRLLFRIGSAKPCSCQASSARMQLSSAMNINRWRKTAICLALAVLSYVIVIEFMPELFALGWHARHGRTAHLRSYDGRNYVVSVPALLFAELDDSGSALSIVKSSGRIRSAFMQPRWALMSFSLSPLYSTAEEMRTGSLLVDARLGTNTTEVANPSIAGEDMHCFERRWERGEAADLSRRFSLADITCVPSSNKRGFSASYQGSRALLPQFYAILNSVKRVDPSSTR